MPKFQTGGVVEDFDFWGVKVPIDLTKNIQNEFYKVWEALKQAGVTHYLADAPYKWKHNMFDPWWQKEISKHASEIAQAKMQSAKQTTGDRVALDLNLGGKTYPLEGNKDTMQELLSEIQKLKAMGYA